MSEFTKKSLKRQQKALRKRINGLLIEADRVEKEGNYVQHKAIWNIIEGYEVKFLTLGFQIINLE